MTQCPYCNRYNGEHDGACPELHDRPESAKLKWQDGYEDGCNGCSQTKKDELYQLGYRVGQKATEDSESWTSV